MNLNELNKKKDKLESELDRVEAKIDKEEQRRAGYKPVKCACDNSLWRITATYNPYKKMAYEWRELIIECTNCGQTEQINVQEDI